MRKLFLIFLMFSVAAFTDSFAARTHTKIDSLEFSTCVTNNFIWRGIQPYPEKPHASFGLQVTKGNLNFAVLDYVGIGNPWKNNEVDFIFSFELERNEFSIKPGGIAYIGTRTTESNMYEAFCELSYDGRFSASLTPWFDIDKRKLYYESGLAWNMDYRTGTVSFGLITGYDTGQFTSKSGFSNVQYCFAYEDTYFGAKIVPRISVIQVLGIDMNADYDKAESALVFDINVVVPI